MLRNLFGMSTHPAPCCASGLAADRLRAVSIECVMSAMSAAPVPPIPPIESARLSRPVDTFEQSTPHTSDVHPAAAQIWGRSLNPSRAPKLTDPSGNACISSTSRRPDACWISTRDPNPNSDACTPKLAPTTIHISNTEESLCMVPAPIREQSAPQTRSQHRSLMLCAILLMTNGCIQRIWERDDDRRAADGACAAHDARRRRARPPRRDASPLAGMVDIRLDATERTPDGKRVYLTIRKPDPAYQSTHSRSS